MNYVVNVKGGFLLTFYIFRGEWLQEDYIKDYKHKTCMTMEKKDWMRTFLFKKFLSFIKRSIIGGIILTNYHLSIFDWHG
jgi:hypothetical protein